LYYPLICNVQQKSLNILSGLYYAKMGKKEILLENYQEYFESAERALQMKKYNAAATLFFKAICGAADLFVLQREGIVPSSHTHRFRIVQEKYPEVYEILNRDFPFYQDSYSKRLDRERVEMLKEDAQTIKRMAEN